MGSAGLATAGPAAGRAQGTQAVAVTEVDGRPVAVTGGGWDGTVRLWDLTFADQQLGDPAPGHGRYITNLAVLDRGRYRLALSAGLDDTAFLWDLEAHRVVSRASVGFTTVAELEELDGHLMVLLAGIGFAQVDHPETGTTVPLSTRHPAEPPYAAGVDVGTIGRVDGRPVAAIVSAGKRLRLYDLATGQIIGRPVDVTVECEDDSTMVNRPAAVALLAVNGRPAAVVLSGHPHLGTRFATGLWDLVDGSRLARLEPATSPAVATTIVDGRPVVVTAGTKGTLRLWDAAARRTLRTIPTGVDHIRYLAAGTLHGSPVVLAASDDGPVITWDLATGTARDEIRLPDTCRGIALGERGALVIGIENDIAVIETEIQGVVPQLTMPPSP